MAHIITLIALLSGAITSLNFLNQKALGQQYGEPCATCTENKYNCDVQAEWDYQRCRRDNPSNPDHEKETHQRDLERCEVAYKPLQCELQRPNGRPPTTPSPSGCADNGTGALTNIQSNGYVSGWAMDGDAQICRQLHYGGVFG